MTERPWLNQITLCSRGKLWWVTTKCPRLICIGLGAPGCQQHAKWVLIYFFPQTAPFRPGQLIMWGEFSTWGIHRHLKLAIFIRKLTFPPPNKALHQTLSQWYAMCTDTQKLTSHSLCVCACVWSCPHYSRLEDNCFIIITILCWFLPSINMNQPQVNVCSLPLNHLPSSHPILPL